MGIDCDSGAWIAIDWASGLVFFAERIECDCPRNVDSGKIQWIYRQREQKCQNLTVLVFFLSYLIIIIIIIILSHNHSISQIFSFHAPSSTWKILINGFPIVNHRLWDLFFMRKYYEEISDFHYPYPHIIKYPEITELGLPCSHQTKDNWVYDVSPLGHERAPFVPFLV